MQEIVAVRVSDGESGIANRPHGHAVEVEGAQEAGLHAAQRFVHQKIDAAVATEVPDAHITAEAPAFLIQSDELIR